MQRPVHHLLDRLGRQPRLAPRSRRIPPQASDAFGQYRSCQRLTVALLLPTARVIAIIPTRSAEGSTIRARQTTFCGVFRRETNRFSAARSEGDSQMHASVFRMPADLHGTPTMGISVSIRRLALNSQARAGQGGESGRNRTFLVVRT